MPSVDGRGGDRVRSGRVAAQGVAVVALALAVSGCATVEEQCALAWRTSQQASAGHVEACSNFVATCDAGDVKACTMIVSGYYQTYSSFFPNFHPRAAPHAFEQAEHAAAVGCRKDNALCAELVNIIDSVEMDAPNSLAKSQEPALLADLDMACTVRHFAAACTRLGRKYRGFVDISSTSERQDLTLANPQLAAHYLAIGCSTEVAEYTFVWPEVVRSWNPLLSREHVTNNPANACQNLIDIYETDKSLPEPSNAAIIALYDRTEALQASGQEVDQARLASDTARDERVEANLADERAQHTASYEKLMDTLQASSSQLQAASTVAPRSTDRPDRTSASTTAAHTTSAVPPPPKPKQQVWLRGTGNTGDYHYGQDYAVSLATTDCELPLQHQCSGRLVHPTLPYTSGSTDDGAFSLGRPFCSEQGLKTNPQFKCTITCTAICESY